MENPPSDVRSGDLDLRIMRRAIIRRLDIPVRQGLVGFPTRLMPKIGHQHRPASQKTGTRRTRLRPRDMAMGLSNCQQIMKAIRSYNAEHTGGSYSDEYDFLRGKHVTSSNSYFKEALIKTGYVIDESIFGCPVSPYVPDGNLGAAPDFAQALEPGENHWIVTSGVSDSAGGMVPLVYENAARCAWPPKWNADARNQPVRGRAWSKGIILGMNDGSVSLWRLERDKGAEVGLRAKAPYEADIFTLQNFSSGEPGWDVLNNEQ